MNGMSRVDCFRKKETASAIPIYPIFQCDFTQWLKKQSAYVKHWVKSVDFCANPGQICLLPNQTGQLESVFFGLADEEDFLAFGKLATVLPNHVYVLKERLPSHLLEKLYLAWGMGAYQFIPYKSVKHLSAQLVLPRSFHPVENMLSCVYMVRDLINLPASEMNPAALSTITKQLARLHGAKVAEVVGKDLVKRGYEAIYAVGKGSANAPRLIDLRFGTPHWPKLTIVGKGVCFDSGGLNVKPSSSMLLMKKDMGGAAHALGLAKLIMMERLPVRLRVLIPAVENMMSGNAYRPGDMIRMRNGKSVEVTNTDAEGRLILADALVEAASEKPNLLIDFATLTGAARVALGPDIVTFFSNDEKLAHEVMKVAQKEADPLWQLPLYQPYFSYLKSNIADFSNSSLKTHAGAVTAALFLQQFVTADTPWIHLDVFGYNELSRPSRPEGGEAMGLRAIFSLLEKRFK